MPRLTDRSEMRAVLLVLMVMLAGCDSWVRRYELTEGKDGAYLVDIRTGRVWVNRNNQQRGDKFYPVEILKDSSVMAPLNKLGKLDQDFNNKGSGFNFKNQYSYKPNTWSDFFEGLGQ